MDTASGAVQEPDIAQAMLGFQAHTMRAMYREIARALADTAPAATPDARRPQDYLLFLTLGKREPLRAAGEPGMADIAEAFDVSRAAAAPEGGGACDTYAGRVRPRTATPLSASPPACRRADCKSRGLHGRRLGCH